MGERGLLEQFPAVLVGRAKAWEHTQGPDAPEQKKAYADRDQAGGGLASDDGVHRRLLMIVFDVDFGHTDPQLDPPVRWPNPGQQPSPKDLRPLLIPVTILL